MRFEIDVSGEDLLSKDYSICVANKGGLIKGFKFDQKLVGLLSLNHKKGIYRYSKSRKGTALFKIRLYSVAIYYIFKEINIKGDFDIIMCKDFDGREKEILNNLKYFFKDLLGIKSKWHASFSRLESDSNAHHYARLMREDHKNKMKTYINLNLKDFEKFLIK